MNLFSFKIFGTFPRKMSFLIHLLQTGKNRHVIRSIHTVITDNFELHNNLSANSPCYFGILICRFSPIN